MDPARLLAIQFALSLLGYAIIYQILLRPHLNRLDGRTALMILGAPQLFRHLGANLLVAAMSCVTKSLESQPCAWRAQAFVLPGAGFEASTF